MVSYPILDLHHLTLSIPLIYQADSFPNTLNSLLRPQKCQAFPCQKALHLPFPLSRRLFCQMATWLGPLYPLQFSSVTQSCPTLWDPMNHSTPGLPVHHELPEFTQTHVHRVGDAIQPSHPLSSPSPPAPNPSQYIQNWITLMYIWNYYKTVNQL